MQQLIIIFLFFVAIVVGYGAGLQQGNKKGFERAVIKISMLAMKNNEESLEQKLKELE